MQGCGRFQAVRRLSQRGLVEVWAARPAGQDSGEPVVIKALIYDPLVEREPFDAECERFVESARAQRALVEAGARSWARVHEISKGEDEAAFVLDRYPRSVQKLIASRAAFDDRLLRWLVGGVLAGLKELRTLGGGRAWGRLRSSNVFIGGERDLGEAPVVLSDLKPPSQVTPADHADDAVQLGRLIYQAVVRRELGEREMLLAGIGSSPEWTRLGPAGEFWRQWCDRLLSASGPSAADLLEEFGRDIGVGEAGDRARPAKVEAVPAAEPIRPAPTGDALAGMESPPTTDDTSATVPAPAGPRVQPGGRKKILIAAAAAALLVGAGVAALSGLLGDRPRPNDVQPDHTPPADPLAELERRVRGWSALLPEGKTQRWWEDEVSRAGGSRSRLEALVGLESVLREAGERLRKASDPRRAGALFAEELSGRPLTVEALRAAASEAVGRDWALRAGEWGSLLPEGAAREWWRGLVERARASEPERALVESLRTGLERARAAFESLPEELRSQAGSAFASAIRAAPVLSVAVIESSAASAVEASRGVDPELGRRLSEAERVVRALPPGAFRERLVGLIESARRDLDETSVSDVEQACAGARPLADAWTLVFEQWKPHAGAAIPAFRDAANPSPAELESAARSVREWLETATALDADAGPLLEALRQGRRLDEPVRLSGGSRDLLAAGQDFATRAGRTPGVDRAVRKIGEVLAEWSHIESVLAADDAAALAARAADEQASLASALTAWRRAGEHSAWPATTEELDSELRAQDVLRRRVVSLSADRAEALRGELEAGARSRWRRVWEAVASHRDFDRLRTLAAAGERLGVPLTWTASARFNAEVAALGGVLSAGGDDAAIKAAVDAFAASVAPLSLDPSVKPGVDAWLRDLTAAATPPPPPRPAGPDWMDRATIGADGVVRHAFAGVEFVFVPIGDHAYMGATEVSLAMANALLGVRQGAPAEMRPLLGLVGNQTSYQRGMRVWEWADRFAVPPQENLPDGRIIPAWIPAQADSSFQNRAGVTWYAPALSQQPVAPTLEAPLQRVSPAGAIFLAGLAQCRLPTETEWIRALQAEPAAEGEANLRDQSWQAQLSHWDGGVAPTATPVAFEDIFVPRDRRVLRASRGSLPMNDGWLWVRPVGEGGGSRIRHLIGNVAEFVTAAEIAPAADAAAANAAVRAAGSDGIRVIGGSALSPPALDPRQANPTANTPYADVGFRLAFTSVPAGPPPEPVIGKVRQAMARAPAVPVP